MERIGFTLRLRQDRIAEYTERHRTVWPEMRSALEESGWGNYSLFLGPNGLLVGYLETEDFGEALRRLKENPVNDKWQAEMTPFFESGENPDDSFCLLQEIFHCG